MCPVRDMKPTLQYRNRVDTFEGFVEKFSVNRRPGTLFGPLEDMAKGKLRNQRMDELHEVWDVVDEEVVHSKVSRSYGLTVSTYGLYVCVPCRWD